jgi:hypothetical protein
MSDKNKSSNHQTERKKIKNKLSYGRKTKISAILKITAILKTCGKNSPIFLNFQARIFMQNVANNKNMYKKYIS